MANTNETLQALADPTRREIFERLRQKPMAVGVLAQDMPISRPAVSQHLAVLKKTGLVRIENRGASRVYHLQPEGLEPLRNWLDQFWNEALAEFAAEFEEKGKEE